MNEEYKNKEARFIRIDAETGCWNWIGAKTNGYGAVKISGKTMRAHRMSYMLYRGEIPSGLVIDHLCRNPSCCNPNHMEAVTQRTNTVRGIGPSAINAAKTHCPNGHELSGHNRLTYNGCSKCRICHNQRCYDRIAQSLEIAAKNKEYKRNWYLRKKAKLSQ